MHIVKLAERVGMDPHFLRERCYPGLSRINSQIAEVCYCAWTVRIMRLLAAHNIFLEMGAGSQWFANNRVSLRLDSKEPLSKVLADPPYGHACSLIYRSVAHSDLFTRTALKDRTTLEWSCGA